MTTIKTGLNTTNRGQFAAANGQVYFTNDFDGVQVWDGVSSSATAAGIAAPENQIGAPTQASGNGTVGDHRVRYRYRNTKTGYVSNPSTYRTVTVTASATDGQFTFGIAASGDDIDQSADSKVDQILVEMTQAGGTVYYQAATATNAATTVVVSLSDETLAAQTLVGVEFPELDNEAPPLCRAMCSHKGRMFFGGAWPYAITSVSVTNASASVTGTGFSTDWGGRRVVFGSDTRSYLITASTATTITLSEDYAGSTDTVSGTVFVAKPNEIFWSEALFPESVNLTDNAREMLNNVSDELTAMASFGSDLLCFGRYSCDRLVYRTDPGVGAQTVPIPGNRGAFNAHCLAEADGALYAWDRQGVYRVDYSRPQQLSQNLDDWLVDNADFESDDKFHMVFDPKDRELLAFLVRNGDTEPQYAVALEIDTGRWSVKYWQIGVTASVVAASDDGQVRAMLGDESGYSWWYGTEGGFDGIAPTQPSVVTAAAGASGTSVPVDETLGTSPDLAGAPAYQVSSGEVRVVASNTSSALTLASAFTVDPSDGDAIYLGAIPWEFRSKWWTAQGLERKKDPAYLGIRLYPGEATGQMLVYFYGDFDDASPLTYTATPGDTPPDGVTITDGGTYATVDLDAGSADGWVPVPVPDGWRRALQYRLVVIRPDGEIRILDAVWMASRDEVLMVSNE